MMMHAAYSPGGHTRSAVAVRPAVAMAIAGCAVAIGACGSSGGGQAAVGATTATGNASPLGLSQCMRAHGVPSFAGPTSAPVGVITVAKRPGPGALTGVPARGRRLRRRPAEAMTVLQRVWRHRRAWLAALALAVVAGVIVVAVLAAGSPSPTTAAGASKGASGAATVRRRNLVQTDTEAGTLSYANPQTVYDRLSGTVTWLPAWAR